jgi:hypothetical protein
MANIYESEIVAAVRAIPYNYGMTKGGTDISPSLHL